MLLKATNDHTPYQTIGLLTSPQVTQVSSFSVDVFQRLVSRPLMPLPLSLPLILKHTLFIIYWVVGGVATVHLVCFIWRDRGWHPVARIVRWPATSLVCHYSCFLFQKVVVSLLVAYLLRENYSETANTFLKECRVLPTGTLLV